MSTAATAEHHSSSTNVSERIVDVAITDPSGDQPGRIAFHLEDGRVIAVPLSWSWRLQEATPEERRTFTIHPSGWTVHWPEVDEDLSARGALRGTPAPRPNSLPPVDAPPSNWSPARIRRLRDRLEMTQAAFADRLGARQATVSDWETGKQTPSRMARRLLDRMAASLEAEADAPPAPPR